MIPLRIDHHELHLLPGRAVWRPSSRTLYIADLHIGKTSAFAKGGIPLSAQVLERTTTADLARLAALIAATGAARLIILGDLLHASAGRDPRTLALLADWRNAHPRTDVALIRGNHDHAAGDPPPSANIRCLNAPFNDEGLALLHHPLNVPSGAPTLAGHLHPAVRLLGVGDAARVPCYWLSQNQLILPAFGTFTGAASIRPTHGDRIFALAGEGDEGVIEIPVVSTADATRKTRLAR